MNLIHMGIVCLFGVVRPTREFFTNSETSPLPIKGYWTRGSVYNSHLRGPVTLTPIAERLAVELSLPFLTAGI